MLVHRLDTPFDDTRDHDTGIEQEEDDERGDAQPETDPVHDELLARHQVFLR